MRKLSILFLMSVICVIGYMAPPVIIVPALMWATCAAVKKVIGN
jgi:hypothetical protein